MKQIASCVMKLGGEPSNLVDLGIPMPRNLRYSTILSAKESGHQPLDLVGAVYEWQHQPMMYLVEGTPVVTVENLTKLRRILAMRGDTPYLGVTNSNKIDVYNLSLDNKSLNDARVYLKGINENQSAIFAELGNCRPDSVVNDEQWISSVILNLLTGTIDRLIQIENYSDKDKDIAISLVGRVLFARFLADRNLVPNNLIPLQLERSVDFGDLFDSREKAEITSNWLDDTFNGDFLPLPDSIFSELSSASWIELGNIMRKAPDHNLYLGWSENWNKLDFAHIPVGVLSQVYEAYLRKHYRTRQKEQGGYYTTSTIANYMVLASFGSIVKEKPMDKIKILDPAAGAGVFLISAFRELVTERWRIDKKRPTTKILREILNNQIRGFDVNDSALKFAALGLYLISIEMDPKPVGNLKFDKLRDRVLFNFSNENDNESSGLGSLGNSVGKEHDGAYDLIIGNPPWASRLRTPNWEIVETTAKSIAKKRGIKDQEVLIPNRALDLAFLWYSMKWAKSSGHIAFLMNARLLFKQGNSIPEVRKILFEKLDFQVVVNCSELRQTKYLPNTEAPFCMVFAKNQIPFPDPGFYLVTPRLEKRMNDADFIRIDSENGDYVDPDSYERYPWTLKAISVGSEEDLNTYSRMHSAHHPTLKSTLENLSSDSKIKQQFHSGVGYIIGKEGSSAFNGQHDPKLEQYKSIPFFLNKHTSHILVKSNNSDETKLLEISKPRDIEIYRGPLLIIGQSPPDDKKRFQAYVSEHDLLYNSSFYGYSFAGHPNGLHLAKYLCLIIKSKITIWQALMASGYFGIERPLITKAELDKFLIPDYLKLSEKQLKEIDNLFDKLNSNEKYNIKELDEWVADLYNLGQFSKQIISDTLEYRLPYADNRTKAQNTPTNESINQFCSLLEAKLNFDLNSKKHDIRVKKCDELSVYPWICLRVNFLDCSSSRVHAISGEIKNKFRRMANYTSNCPFLVHTVGPDLLIGILSQRRFWNLKEARLLSLKISYSDFVDSLGNLA